MTDRSQGIADPPKSMYVDNMAFFVFVKGKKLTIRNAAMDQRYVGTIDDVGTAPRSDAFPSALWERVAAWLA